jgi:hypothetical protein
MKRSSFLAIILVAVLFTLLGFAPAVMATNDDHDNGHSSDPAQTQGQGQSQGQGQKQGQGQGQSQATDVSLVNDVSSESKSFSRSVSGAVSDSDAESDATSNSGGNTITSTYQQVRQPVNTAVAVAGMNTSSCIKTGAVGVQFIGVGASVSLPKRDHDCALEQAAEKAYARNNKTNGDLLTCMTSYMRKAYPQLKLCLASQNELVAAPRTDGTGTDYVSPDEERARRQAARPQTGK